MGLRVLGFSVWALGVLGFRLLGFGGFWSLGF